jgi:hypothetical protein
MELERRKKKCTEYTLKRWIFHERGEAGWRKGVKDF